MTLITDVFDAFVLCSMTGSKKLQLQRHAINITVNICLNNEIISV